MGLFSKQRCEYTNWALDTLNILCIGCKRSIKDKKTDIRVCSILLKRDNEVSDFGSCKFAKARGR